MTDKIRDGLAYGGCATGVIAATAVLICDLTGNVSRKDAFIVAGVLGAFSMMVAFMIRFIQLVRGEY